jgi:SNF2 family DNA or RNA helicase
LTDCLPLVLSGFERVISVFLYLCMIFQVQIVSFLNWLVTARRNRGPFLVVAPLSTLPHWQREVETWTNMNAIVYHGDQESRDLIYQHEFFFQDDKGNAFKESFKWHILLTSPEIVLQDVLLLKHIQWEVLICDEAQRLKNNVSRFYKELVLFNFSHCVLLSGTPLQNSVKELYALLAFMDPASFPDEDAFLEQYADMKDSAHVHQLQEVIRPFMLRRLKGDVEKSLPGKEETLVEVELTTLQKKFYRAVFERNAEHLCRMTSSKSMPSLMNISMQLRKCCNHPWTLEGVEQAECVDISHHDDYMEKTISASGKLVLLDKLLPRLREQGHKVLIFSQMTKVPNNFEFGFVFLMKICACVYCFVLCEYMLIVLSLVEYKIYGLFFCYMYCDIVVVVMV